ncbi:D-alanyl-D-alanine carboxypeptidase/D-alanyl-D-alanine-endopeptidase [Anaerobacillus sp. MEB173]|uniref:D-alanyl-D-alanine carboxypeptidase/D-alanyl-D-alanine endopeptidase n=1 Tax=Anaerobacillus sp. MEB173 TaxID=3383345 RepID=UPI003F8E0E7F
MKNLQKRLVIFLFSFILALINHQAGYAIDNISCKNKLDQLLTEQHNLKGSIASISVRSASDGRIIYDHNADVRVRPASNIKLLTAAAALSSLGEDYSFQTEVLSDGEKRWKVHFGDVYLKGGGDPTLIKSSFDELAKQLRKSGIKVIRGNLIGDDSRYDDIRYSIDLPWSDETMDYGGPVSALTASISSETEAGSVVITVQGGNKIGERSIVTVEPTTNYITIDNQTKTVGVDEEKVLTIQRKHGTNKVVVSGTIPIQSMEKEPIAVWEPTGYALDLFYQALVEQGIKVSGKKKIGKAPDNVHVLASITSRPLADILIPFMKFSHNTYGEMLTKEMGKVVFGEGSWERGLAVIQAELMSLGVNTKTIVLRDGSGISHVNLIPANEITKLLYAVQQENWFASYRQLLPCGGESELFLGGTLKSRFKEPHLKGKIKAKTGTISTVSSLSGFVETKSGETVIFSILLNNLLDGAKGKEIEDHIVRMLAAL